MTLLTNTIVNTAIPLEQSVSAANKSPPADTSHRLSYILFAMATAQIGSRRRLVKQCLNKQQTVVTPGEPGALMS